MTRRAAISRTPRIGVRLTPLQVRQVTPWFHGCYVTESDAMTKTHAPIVERVAGWSARHRKTVVIGWLLLVVAAVVIGQRLGTAIDDVIHLAGMDRVVWPRDTRHRLAGLHYDDARALAQRA